jgi:DNA-binding beta-propeller fold protein YncE
MRNTMLLLIFTLFVVTCSEGPSGTSGPSGPTPAVLVDHEFGEPPVEGTLRVVPGPGTEGWRYRIDAIPPESQVREGSLEGVIAIPYRFDTPGVHVIRVELLGPEGSQVVEKPIVVVDPESDFEILAQRPVEEIWPDAATIYPEGIVLDPAGRWLYAANYWTGELVRIDPATLGVVDRLQLTPQLEGLTVTPSGDRLFGVHKGIGLSVVDLASFTGTFTSIAEGHFIHALNETDALVSGSELQVVDIEREAVEHRIRSLSIGAPYFAVFPGKQRIAATLNRFEEHPSLVIFSLPSLASIRTIPLSGVSWANQVAVGPQGDRIYVIGEGEDGRRFFLVDANTGEVLNSITLTTSRCTWCAANPVVGFASGRYVAFEQNGSVVIVDTELDLPRFLFQPGGPVLGGPAGVAAHPTSEILFVLGGNASPLQLYKIRLQDPVSP